jgi:hypothetical protein
MFFSCQKVGLSNQASSNEKIVAIMGDWQGNWTTTEGTVLPLAAQVIALDSGKYEANLLSEFDTRDEHVVVLDGKKEGSETKFMGHAEVGKMIGTTWRGDIKGEQFVGTVEGNKTGTFELRKVMRLSPRLGAKPPAGAIVLFDGTNLDEWEHVKDPVGFLNLAKTVGGTDCAAYLRTKIRSEQRQEAVMEVGSDDGIKIWINGEVVHATNEGRGYQPGQEKVNVILAAGWNEIMLKVTNGGGGWGAGIRLVDPNGNVLKNIGEMDIGGSGDEGSRKHLDSREGYLTEWTVSGPYQEEDKKGSQIFYTAFAPERTENQAEWRPFSMERDYSTEWKLADDGMEVLPGSGSIVTKRKFGDVQLHVEFRTPFMPHKKGQARGNSGVYLQGRYEVQVLDSYGLEGKDNECGGIYKIAPPLVNMCAPPMQWQTYDITFYGPRFDDTGEMVRSALLTVLHNGVKIHDNTEVPKPTGGETDNNLSEPGGLSLQDHGDRVQYRNIWLVEL